MTPPFTVLDTGRMSRRSRTVLAVALAIGVLVLGVAARRPAGEGLALDPEGTGKLGAKGLVLLLAEGGADVRVSARSPDASRTTTVVLRDTFDAARRAEILAWVDAGGTLVVTDPRSPLGMVRPHLSPSRGSSGADEIDVGCDSVPALKGVGRVDASGSLVYSREGRAPGAIGCFATKDGDFLVATPHGTGTIVALGGAGLWINDNLDRSGNAGLAVALIAPRPATRTQVLSDLARDAGEAGVGQPDERGMFDVLPRGARVALAQIVLAFVIAVLWRARRLGRPVDEVQPVDIPGSELVVATGNMHHKGGHRRRAAAVLSGRARDRVADRLGVPRRVSPQELATITATRCGMDAGTVLAGLAPADPADDAALVRVAIASDAVVQAVSGPPPIRGDEIR